VKTLSSIRKQGLAITAVVVVVLASAVAIAAARTPTVRVPAPDKVANAWAPSALAKQLSLARAATAKYAENLPLAKANGYSIITKMIPNMGYHFMNASVKGFDVTKPPILVYEHRGSTWQLGALEWVFTSKPATPPLPGARYGSFGAGCHYTDGTFVPATAQTACPKVAPKSGAAFTFWHPVLITMHVWLWYPNPTGLFASTNPLAAPFNQG
jgi:hypothetical protein